MAGLNLSHFIRTSWKLSAKENFKIGELGVSVRYLDKSEANKLAELVRRKSVLVRLGGAWNFYYQRIQGLGESTVIEVFRKGHPDAVYHCVEQIATVLETVLLLSSSLTMSRKQFQKHLAITTHRHYGYSVTIGPNFYTLRSKATSDESVSGIPLNQRFLNRFLRLKFPVLVQFCTTDSEIAQRVSSSLGWLLESRQEPSVGAAVVKTAIALESLLIFNETEPLSRSLSERCAFILSQDPSERALISKQVRDFYDIRSGIVHSGRRKNDAISLNLLESFDRLALFLCLLLAINNTKWSSKESLRSIWIIRR